MSKPERPNVWKRGEDKPTRPDVKPPTEDQRPERGGGGYWGGHGGGGDAEPEGYEDRHGD